MNYLCPICGEELTLKEKSYICCNNHCFDRAKSGYVNLIPPNKKNSSQPGDNKEMIQARLDVMDYNYYLPLANKVIEIIGNKNKAILDAGCGTGYILDRVANTDDKIQAYGTDISKFAIDAASKRYKKCNFSVASSLRLPFKDESFDVVICTFAPVYNEEFARVLKKDGLLIRVVPAENHLMLLKKTLYETPTPNEMEAKEIQGFDFISVEVVKSVFSCKKETGYNLVKMTPYFYHAPKENIEKILNNELFETNTEFEVRTYKKTNCTL